MAVMRTVSGLLKIAPRRKLRLRLRDLHDSKCPLPMREYLTLPFAVNLNRLATDFFVFCFGI